MKFEQFEDNIIEWATAREIYAHSTAQAQFVKAVEEMGELAGNLSKGKSIEDDLADIIVCLINVAYLEDVSLNESFDLAWNEIKDRKGRMVPGGAFIKEEDL